MQTSTTSENGSPDRSRSGDQGPERHGPGRISTEPAPRTGRLLAFAAGGVVLLLVAGFGVAYGVHHRHEASAERQADQTRDAKDAVEVVTVRGTANSYPLALPGQTAGYYQSTIYARVDGYIGKWMKDIGDRVKQGDVLCTVDTPELDQQLVAARAKAAASDAMVRVARSNEKIAKVTYDRWRDSPKGVVSDQEREQKEADYEAAQARLAQAEAQADLDRADAGRYQAMKSFQQVAAPYDGIITARKIDVGDLVSAGSSANTSPLYGIAQSDVIRVYVDVPQKAAAQMSPGLVAHASSDQYPGRTFDGTVARSAMSIDPQTRTERVEVDLPNKDLTLVPGMYVQVTFELTQHGLLEVPAAAILSKPGGPQVAVVGDDGKVAFRPVTIAKDDGDTVELSDGVRLGDKVALNISSAITPGQQVTAVDDEQAAPPPPPAQPLPAPTVRATAGSPIGGSPADHPPAPDSGVHPPAPAKPPQGGPVGG